MWNGHKSNLFMAQVGLDSSLKAQSAPICLIKLIKNGPEILGNANPIHSLIKKKKCRSHASSFDFNKAVKLSPTAQEVLLSNPTYPIFDGIHICE